jgi:hypothetical protein
VTDPHKTFSPDEFKRMGRKGQMYIYKERNNDEPSRNQRGNSDRDVSEARNCGQNDETAEDAGDRGGKKGADKTNNTGKGFGRGSRQE